MVRPSGEAEFKPTPEVAETLVALDPPMNAPGLEASGDLGSAIDWSGLPSLGCERDVERAATSGNGETVGSSIQSMSQPKRVGMAVLMALALLALLVTPALAAFASLPGNATISSGTTRNITASWGNNAPYNVTFRCNGFPNCVDFLATSTAATSINRSGSITTCVDVSRTVTLAIRESGGATANAASTTTWTGGAFCE